MNQIFLNTANTKSEGIVALGKSPTVSNDEKPQFIIPAEGITSKKAKISEETNQTDQTKKITLAPSGEDDLLSVLESLDQIQSAIESERILVPQLIGTSVADINALSSKHQAQKIKTALSEIIPNLGNSDELKTNITLTAQTEIATTLSLKSEIDSVATTLPLAENLGQKIDAGLNAGDLEKILSQPTTEQLSEKELHNLTNLNVDTQTTSELNIHAFAQVTLAQQNTDVKLSPSEANKNNSSALQTIVATQGNLTLKNQNKAAPVTSDNVSTATLFTSDQSIDNLSNEISDVINSSISKEAVKIDTKTLLNQSTAQRIPFDQVIQMDASTQNTVSLTSANDSQTNPIVGQTVNTQATGQLQTQTNTTVQNQQNINMAQPNWPISLMDNIQRALRDAQDNFEISLSPENLGKVNIKLDMRGDIVNVNIVTDTQDAARLFNDNQSRLSDMFAKAGLELGQHSSQHQSSSDTNEQNSNTARNTNNETTANYDAQEQSVSSDPKKNDDGSIDIVA